MAIINTCFRRIEKKKNLKFSSKKLASASQWAATENQRGQFSGMATASRFCGSNGSMALSNVRSIPSLQRLRLSLIALSGDWTEVLGQIRFAIRRIEEHFGSHWPAYWNRQVAKAEVSLSEALDNLSRLQARGPGRSQAAHEAQQRVGAARRRLALCQDKQLRAKRVALAVEMACQRLAGPAAEVAQHAEVNLPQAAVELAALIDHLSRYAEIQPATGAANTRTARSISENDPPPTDQREASR